MHRDTPNNETVIVEYGFVDSPNDDSKQIKDNYKAYVEAVVRAIADYANIPYTAKIDSGYYTVVKGDTLWKIATKYGLTVDKLKNLNKLANNELKVGQTLKVSSAEEEIVPEDYLLYKVKNGDSLWKIANEYDTTVDILMKVNNLNNANLTINQQLFIPKTSKMGVNDKKTYVVEKGDSLYSISKKYNIDINELKKINNISNDILSVGQVLIIPKISTGEINYIVTKGDNLYSIANKYGVNIEDIKELNNLTSNLISIGQIIKIPGSTNYNTYIVNKGDSLWKIANTYGTTVNKLMTINNLNNSNLTIGQSLLIPTN